MNNNESSNMEIALLVEKAKITEVFTKYTTSVDFRDWASLQSIFTARIERDLSSFTGAPAEVIESAQHVAECTATLPGFDSTQHFLLNNKITVNGDQAGAIVYMMADHTLVDNGVQKQFTIRGYYTFRFVREGVTWKICGMKLSVLSTQGDQSLFGIAAQRVGG